MKINNTVTDLNGKVFPIAGLAMIQNSQEFAVKDENGKEFKTTDEAIRALVTDESNLDQSLPAGKRVDGFKLSIQNSAGEETDSKTLIDMIRDDQSADPIVALDVKIEVTHSGSNKNYGIYESESMEQDMATFIAPYNKPFLKNHDSHEEPLGRTIDTNFGASALVMGRDAITNTFRVTDMGAIEKFLDGRYTTVSIGGTASHIKCDLCKKPIVKDGKFSRDKFCGHWRGETYDNQVARWIYTGLEYQETSVVNMPADQYAQVVSMKAVTKSQLGAEDQNQPGDDFANAVDGILGTTPGAVNNNTANSSPETKPEDGQQTPPPATEPGAGTEPPAGTEDGAGAEPGQEPGKEPDTNGTKDKDSGTGNPEPKIEALQKDLKESKDANQELQTKLTKAETDLGATNDQLEILTKKVADLETENTELETKLSDQETETGKIKELNLALAKAYKDELVGAIMLFDPKANRDELYGQSVKALIDLKKEKVSSRQIPRATSPGIVDNKNDPNATEDSDETKKPKVTMGEAMDQMVARL